MNNVRVNLSIKQNIMDETFSYHVYAALTGHQTSELILQILSLRRTGDREKLLEVSCQCLLHPGIEAGEDPCLKSRVYDLNGYSMD